jgi:hypothetical protein
MVKPIVPPEVQDPIGLLHDRPGGLGKPLLESLIPYGVHLAVSVYDDRKDTLVRTELAERVNELDALLARSVVAVVGVVDLERFLKQHTVPCSLSVCRDLYRRWRHPSAYHLRC